MALISTLYDPFDGSAVDTSKWTVTGTAAVSGGRVGIATATAYGTNKLTSASTYTLEESSIIIEFEPPSNAGAGNLGTDHVYTSLRINGGAGNYISVLVDTRPLQDRIYHQVWTGGTEDGTFITGGTNGDYVAASHRWAKVSETGNVLSFHFSADGVTWGTAVRTMTTPAWVTGNNTLNAELSAVKVTGTASTGYVYGVNPASVPVTPPAGETFADVMKKFRDDGSLVSYWPLNDTYTTTDVMNGRNLTQEIKSGSGSGPVTFDATGAYFNGKNYLRAADHSAFSLVTTSELSIIVSVDPDSFASGGVNTGTWRTSGTGSDTDYYKHWMGKGTAGQHEWTFRHYAKDVPSILSDRPAAISMYHYTAAGDLGVGNRVNNQDTVSGYINLATWFDQDSPTHATYPGSCSLYTQGIHRLTTNFNASYAQIIPSNTTSPVTIGTRGDFSGWLVGKVRRVAIFNRKLTPAEIDTINDAQGLPEGSWGGIGTPSTTFFAGLRDSFTGSFDGAWVFNNAGTIVGGTAHLASDTTAGNGIRSGYVYTLKDSYVQMQLGAPVDTTGGTAAGTYSRAIIDTAAAPTSKLEITVNPVAGTMNFTRHAAGVVQTPGSGNASITYSPTQHAWVRFKEQAGSILWQTSADGATWATQRTDPTPAWIGTVSDQRLYLDVVKTAGAATYAVVDNVNSQAFSSLVDSFTSQDTSKWSWVGGAAVTSGQVQLPCTGTGNYPNGFNSNLPYALADGDAGFTIKVAGLPSGLGRLSIDLAASLPAATGTPYSTKVAGWFIDQVGSTAPQIEANYVVGGVSNGVLVDRKDWLNIRRNGANVEWRTSSDGATWGTPVRTVAVASLPAMEALYAVVRSRNNGTVTGNYVVDDVGAVPKVPAAPANLVAAADVGAIALSWDSAPAAEFPVDSYRLTWLPGGATPVTLGPTAISYSATGLTPGTAYTFSLEAHNTPWGYSLPATVTETPDFPEPVEPTDPPSEPTNVIVTAGAASVVVSWTAPVNPNGTITGYRVIDQTGTQRGTVTGTGTATTVTGLLDGLTYIFRVIATNENGDSLPSQPSAPFTPNPAGTTTGPLVDRACFGAYLTGSYAETEAVTGRVLQPVVRRHLLNAPFPAREVDDLGLRDRSMMLLLDTTGFKTQDIIDGEYDTLLGKLAEGITESGRYVYVAPFFAANDFVQVWSPQHTGTIPWYDAALSCETRTVGNYLQAFEHVARRLRASQYVRVVWAVSVDPQPDPAAEVVASYYPGPSADVAMLVGHNYGLGPEQGKPGLTEWLTPAAIFDTPYAAVVAAIPPTTPVWLWTGCHEPGLPYVPNGPGFAPGDMVAADLVHDKAGWVDLLLGATTWPRVQAVVWNDTAGERDWRINSSPATAAAFHGQLGDPDDWVRTEVTQDRLGDHVRKLVSNTAKWARSGANPATRTNEYDRPDARSGVRVSMTHVTPYSAGAKRTATVTQSDMLNWNRLHGFLLRQAARYGIQAWAYSSGALPANETALLYPGTPTVNGVTMSSSADATPGATMQKEGGMKVEAGS